MKSELEQFINDKISNADSERTAIQWECVRDWGKANFHASIEAATGFGKTRVGYNAIEIFRREQQDRRVIIVVPTTQLKTQWSKELKKRKMHVNTEVFVINSLIKSEHDTDMLIMDECHRYAAHTFSLIFKRVKYWTILGLTATMKRLDRKDLIIRQFAPIVKKIPMHLCRAKGWTAKYKEFHWGIELSQEDSSHYSEMHEKYLKYMRVFSMDFDLMQRCLSNPASREHVVLRNRGRLTTDQVYHMSIQALRMIRLIKSWLIEHPSKILAAEQLINAMDRKTLTFGESTSIADTLAELLGKKARSLHSDMRPMEIETFKDKPYKTERGARKWCEAHPEYSYKLKHGKHIAQTRVTKKLAGKRLIDHILHKIKETSQVNTLCTAKKLNEGFDFPGADMGITLSRSSSPTVYTQQTGRVCRIGGKHDPIMVHIYIKATKDEKWLQKASKNAVGVIQVSSLEEIMKYTSQLQIENVLE